MASSNDSRQGLYAELDTLLDTRLGTLARMGEEIAVHALSNGYHVRESDHFPHQVDLAAYQALYARRDHETLAHSATTGVIELLRQLAAIASEQAVTRPFHSGPVVYVNLHPYDLTLQEKDEMQKAIAAWLSGTTAQVELISISEQSLTPDYCKALNFAAMFLYDFGAWMELHAKAFETTRLNDVTVFGPAIFSTVPTEEQKAQMTKEVGSPFQAMEMLASPIIDLKLLPVSEFSTIVKPPRHGISTHPAP